MKTELVIFDMDGTLLDTLQDLADCTNYLLKQHNYPEHPLDAYRYFVGNGIRKLIERAIPETERTSEKIDALFAEFMPYYEIHKADKTRPYPGIMELLKTLQERGIKLAIASNKAQEAMLPLTDFYFPGISFEAVLGNRVGIPPKPDPTIVEDILKMTNTAKANTLYVGDTAVDMQTASAAGLTKIGVLWGFRTLEELQQANADFIIKEPLEIVSLLHKS